MGELMVLQAPKPMWRVLDHECQEQLNTHGMVLDRRTDIEHHNNMIYTMKKSACGCLPVPDLAYSHSIVNEPFLQFNINGLLVGVGGNTMKNTMLRNFFKKFHILI